MMHKESERKLTRQELVERMVELRRERDEKIMLAVEASIRRRDEELARSDENERLLREEQQEEQQEEQAKPQNKPKIADNRPFAKKYPRLNAMRGWLLTSRMVVTTTHMILDAQFTISHDVSTNAFNETIGLRRHGLGGMLKRLALKANGIDGYDHLNKTLTCADGTTLPFGPNDMTWKMVLFSLLALPSRPETVVAKKYVETIWDGESRGYKDVTKTRYIPQISALQMLRNLIGGYLPLNEKITGENDNGEKASIYKKWRWTEKKGFIFALAVFRIPVFLAINLVTYPFRLARNLIRSVTEIVFPLLSLLVIVINIWAYSAFKFSTKFTKENSRNLLVILGVLASILTGVLNLTLFAGQYLMSLACRAGLAFSSPLKSAWLAYNSGVLILGPENSTNLFSRFVGGLGFVLSIALSATVWAIVLPLALGALVAAVPALLTPITALSQSPFIATVLGWLTQLPFAASVSSVFGTAFGVVGGALVATFGKAILGLGAIFTVAIPEVIVAFSLVMSIVVMPVASLITWGVEVISNAFMRWVEQSSFSNLFSKKDKFLYETVKANNLYFLINNGGARVQQPEKGGMIILTPACTRLVTESEQAKAVAERALVSSLLVTDEKKLKLLVDKAAAGNGYRFATDDESNKGTLEKPAVVKDDGESVPIAAY